MKETGGESITNTFCYQHPCRCLLPLHSCIMKETGGERVTDMFCYQHHAIPVLVITATNCILEATRQLTNAINRVQEAPPDEMAAIQNLFALLLGKVTLQEPEPCPQPCRPKAPLTVSPPAGPEHDDAPICMWNLHADETPAIHKSCPSARLPTSPAPAMIKDIIEEFNAPLIPIDARSPACGHYVQPPQAQSNTRCKLREHKMHMINSTVSNALMPRPVTATASTPPAIGYAFGVHQLALSKLATNQFISAIIDKDTGAILEYHHLVKNPVTKLCGKQVLQTK
jgi:hypothetical protein